MYNRPIKVSQLFVAVLLIAGVSSSHSHLVFAQQAQLELVAEHTVKEEAAIKQYRGMPPVRAALPVLTYPVQAQKNGVEGRVIVKYKIDKTGQVYDAELLRGIGYGCDENALTFINQVKFQPVLDDAGEPVDQWFITPVKFKLTK